MIQEERSEKLLEDVINLKGNIHKSNHSVSNSNYLSMDIKFEELFDIDEIQALQDEFSEAAGVASIITMPNGENITGPSNFSRLCNDIIRKTENGKANCFLSDSLLGEENSNGPNIHNCINCGLLDAGVRISIGTKHIATWIIGQVRDENQTIDKVLDFSKKNNIEYKIISEAYEEVQKMSKKQFSDVSNLLFILAKQLSITASHNLKQYQMIQDLKITSTKLASKEKELKSIFRAAPAGIGVVENRNIIQVNQRFCEILGYSRNELLGENSRILYPNDEEYEYVGKNKYEQIKLTGTGSVETKFLCKDNSIKDILLNSTPLDLNDMTKGVTFTALDISYLKNKERELYESERKYRSMMEAMDDSVYICSPSFKVEYMNPAMIKRTGYNALGETCYQVLHGQKQKCPWCVFDEILKKKKISTDLVSPLDNKAYHVSYSPIMNPDDTTSMLTILRDISDFKLMQDNILQMQKMESLGTLAGGIAHDFNNILTPMIGYVELALNKVPYDSKERTYLNKALSSTQRASELIHQILTISRSAEHKFKPVEAQLVIKEALILLRASIPSSIVLNQEIDMNCGYIMADPVNIHQLVMNLCTNAFHAMEEGGGTMSITYKEVENNNLRIKDFSNGSFACLKVTDTGHGMKDDVVERIFDPYFTTKVKGKGTGLGLFITQKIVTEIGGTIKVSSEINKGTEFNIVFPLMRSHIKEDVHQTKDLIGGSERILIIDDESSIAEMEIEMLEYLGYNPTMFTSSIDALNYFKEHPQEFDLVITDMTMPDMQGDKLASEMIKIRNDIPILLSTGSNDVISAESINSLGIQDLVLKPISMNALSQKIREVLDRELNK